MLIEDSKDYFRLFLMDIKVEAGVFRVGVNPTLILPPVSTVFLYVFNLIWPLTHDQG